MKRGALPLAVFAAGALAQAPADDVTTVTYATCPSATTVTVTLSNTITYCPGGYCNVTPTGNGNPANTITQTDTETDTATTTTTTTAYITVYPAPCPNGKKGMCDATYTIIEDCPCTKHDEGYIPQDFTTTVHECGCGENGEQTTITQTIPCSTGAYAHVTPVYGDKWTGRKPEIPIEDDNGYESGGKGGKGGNGGNGGNGGKGGAGKPVADDEAGEGAGAGGKPAGGAPAGGKPVAADEAGAGGKGAGAGGKPVAADEAGAGGKGADAGGKPVAAGEAGAAGAAPAGGAGAGAGGKPVAAGEAGAGAGGEGAGENGVKDYTGSANKAAFALSTVFAGVVGALAIML